MLQVHSTTMHNYTNIFIFDTRNVIDIIHLKTIYTHLIVDCKLKNGNQF